MEGPLPKCLNLYVVRGITMEFPRTLTQGSSYDLINRDGLAGVCAGDT